MSVLIEFNNVRNFEQFMKDILMVLNVREVLDLINKEKISAYMVEHKILLVNIMGVISTASSEEWHLLDSANVKIGSIKTTYIDEHIFLFGNGWKLLDDEIIDEVFIPDQKNAGKGKILKFIQEEKKKILDHIKKGKGDVQLDQNLALILRKWSVPIEPVKMFLEPNLPEKFLKFMEIFATKYENSYPIKGIEKYVENVSKISEESFLGYEEYKVEWDKIMKSD